MRKWQPQGFVPRIAPHRDQSLIPCIFLADPSKLDPVKWIKLVDFPQISPWNPAEFPMKPPFHQAMTPQLWLAHLAKVFRCHSRASAPKWSEWRPSAWTRPNKMGVQPTRMWQCGFDPTLDTFGIWTHLETIKHHQTMEFATQRHFRCSADWFQGKSTGNLAFCSPQMEGGHASTVP